MSPSRGRALGAMCRWKWRLLSLAVAAGAVVAAGDVAGSSAGGERPAQACVVPHPQNENHTLDGADLHYKMSRFYDGTGPPPLEEIFFATQNLTRPTQEDLMRACPGLLISSFVMLAEARLPVAPVEAAGAIQKAEDLASRLTEEEYEVAIGVWPVRAAFAAYRALADQLRRQADERGDAPAPVAAHVVVCHCRESLAWLSDGHLYVPKEAHLDLFVYEKCLAPGAPARPLEDFGVDRSKFRRAVSIPVQDGDVRRDECSAYLRHLVDHYTDPADYTFFFQADAGDHLQWEYLALVLRAMELRTLSAPFVHLNHPRLVASLSPCRAEVFRQIFGRPPAHLGSYCCAQFAVSRARVLANPLERYETMLRMLFGESPEQCHDIPGHSTHCLMYEVYWHALFGEPDSLPYRADNPALPLFLRIRDIENESYLPPGSLYLQLAIDREADAAYK